MIHVIDLYFRDLPKAIAAFLVTTKEGPVLIETGPHSTLPHLQQGVEAAGYSLTDIQHVLLSHIHLDHAGAAWYLAQQGAMIYVHPSGAPHLNNPQRLMASARRIYQDDMDRLWGQMNAIPEEQLITMENGVDLEIGETIFKPWHTPGHAIHHIAWQMAEVLFTGDLAGVKIDKGPVMPPCPPPDINIEAWVQSIHLVRNLDIKEIYLTHYGSIKAIGGHLDELEHRLRAWAEWIKPYWQRQVPADEIVAPFQQFVARELAGKGLSATEISTYEAANPSWMSVYGLLRYWNKK